MISRVSSNRLSILVTSKPRPSEGPTGGSPGKDRGRVEPFPDPFFILLLICLFKRPKVRVLRHTYTRKL